MSERLISVEELAALAAEDTNAHRLWTGNEGWVERFGEDFLISHPETSEGEVIAKKLSIWAQELGLAQDSVFLRTLVKQPGESDVPRRLSGEGELRSIVRERGLRFGIDFAAGYSAGLFCDQRANRAHLESLRPGRVLNCFAYTCAFSVAAARAGAGTVSLDLSRKSLDRGRENFALNGLDAAGHRFIADDVLAVLPRLVRRGEKFDAIILDPPTFSRNAKGRVFRVERDMADLLDLACGVASAGAKILISTNALSLNVPALRRVGRDRGLDVQEVPPPSEYPAGAASSTVWMS